MNKDIYGRGLLSYWQGDQNAVFVVESDIAETEEWPIEVFFRDYKNMPKAEQKALSMVDGSILDVGAGAGSHALYLQEKGKNVTTMDISTGAVEVMKQRRIKHIIQEDFFRYKGDKFDTLLFLMNGIGIAGQLDKLPLFFEKCKQLLNPGGKIILDSSDIIYLFVDEEDGSVMLNLNDAYYGEVEYRYLFKEEAGEAFNWLFVDFETLCEYAEASGFSCKKIYEDSHYLYLAELILKP